MYEVVLSEESTDFYANAVQSLAAKLARCFAQLETEPRKHNNIKPLKGKFKGMLRYRVGDHRVVNFIEESRKKVIVSMIVHRSEVYE